MGALRISAWAIAPKGGWATGVLAACVLGAVPAQAQRADENVNTQSDDAFGRAVGNDRSGLYSSFEVRGFNPSEAGNVRMQGLYFDLIDLPSARLIQGNTIRVGLAAQRYPFPAPTGLVDYELALPQDQASLSVELDSAGSQIEGPGVTVNFKLPLDGKRLGIAGGIAGRNALRMEGGRHHFRTAAGSIAFRPSSEAEFVAFAGKIFFLSDEARPTYFPAGLNLPPQVPRAKFLGLDWTERDNFNTAMGLLARFGLGGGYRVEAGLFDSRRSSAAFADLMLGVTPDGHIANRLAVASRGDKDRSLSGEFRLIREWRSGAVGHKLTASVRGRAKNRLFGGSKFLPLGEGSVFDTPDKWPEPAYTLDPKNRDRVRQLTGGLAYSLFWAGRASLDIGLSKQHYSKTIDFADPALPDPVSRDRPLVWNLAGSVALTRRLIAFAGLSRGQEDAIVAPDIAINRSEAPPAIRTKQVEAGLRYSLTPHLSLVAGAFSISKPYFNLDPASRYRQLGTLTNRGIELSLTGKLAPGLSLVGGMLLLDPRISGEAVDSGLIGRRPVGQVRRRIAANLDWRSRGGTGPLSIRPRRRKCLEPGGQRRQHAQRAAAHVDRSRGTLPVRLGQDQIRPAPAGPQSVQPLWLECHAERRLYLYPAPVFRAEPAGRFLGPPLQPHRHARHARHRLERFAIAVEADQQRDRRALLAVVHLLAGNPAVAVGHRHHPALERRVGLGDRRNAAVVRDHPALRPVAQRQCCEIVGVGAERVVGRALAGRGEAAARGVRNLADAARDHLAAGSLPAGAPPGAAA